MLSCDVSPDFSANHIPPAPSLDKASAFWSPQAISHSLVQRRDTPYLCPTLASLLFAPTVPRSLHVLDAKNTMRDMAGAGAGC